MTQSITSPQNPRVKNAAKLRDRRARERQRRFIIDGAREIAAALRGNVAIEELFVWETQLEDQQVMIEQATRSGAQVITVPTRVYDKLAFGNRNDGLVATAPLPERSLDGIRLPPDALVVVLEGVEKPGNLGAVLRTADAAGAAAVIAADAVCDLYNPNAIRASLGALFLKPIAAASAVDTLDWLKHQQLPIFAAWVGASQHYSDADLRSGAALVLGSEAHGLTDVWRDGDVQPISLPMAGTVDSLNVSSTAAVLMFEAVRQRRSA